MKKIYTCPMHSEVKQNKPGKCPKCGMKLILKSDIKNSQHLMSHSHKTAPTWKRYLPLMVIIGLILLTSLVISYRDIQTGTYSVEKTISYFMAGFFLVFAGFKLMDLKGFAEGYSTYDLLAKRWFPYGYIYPFIELSFGLAMIIGFQPKLVLFLELIIMTFSGIGVAIKLAKHERFECACLGTFLKVPLTKVTLMEDFGMAALALLLLLSSGIMLSSNKMSSVMYYPHKNISSGHSSHHMTEINNDRDFIINMIPHHQEAVDVSIVVASRTSDETVKRLAETIVVVQMEEVERLKLWLQDWYQEDYSSNDDYAKMMQSNYEKLSEENLNKQYITEMIAHHQGAIQMAKQINSKTERDEIKRFSDRVIAAQSKEMNQMKGYLKQDLDD